MKTQRRSHITHLPSLTPLRGIAALLIVLAHFTGSLLPNLDLTGLTMLFSNGYLAVDLFFLMSGVVIAHVYGLELGRGLSVETSAAFFRARFARLYPLHFCTLAYLVLISMAMPALNCLVTGRPLDPVWEGFYSFEETIRNLVLTHGFWNENLTWNYPSWSLSTEFFAYLAFPVVAPLLAVTRRREALLGIAVLFMALWWLVAEQGSLNIVVGPSFLRCLLQFGIGTLLHRLYLDGAGWTVLRRDETFLVAAAAAVLVMHFDLADMLIVPLFMILVLAGIHNDGRVSSSLNAPVLVWLGNLSFSLYMTHGIVEFMTRVLLAYSTGHPDGRMIGEEASWLLLATMLIFTFALSDAAYRRIEIPARHWLKTASLSRRRPATASPWGSIAAIRTPFLGRSGVYALISRKMRIR